MTSYSDVVQGREIVSVKEEDNGIWHPVGPDGKQKETNNKISKPVASYQPPPPIVPVAKPVAKKPAPIKKKFTEKKPAILTHSELMAKIFPAKNIIKKKKSKQSVPVTKVGAYKKPAPPKKPAYRPPLKPAPKPVTPSKPAPSASAPSAFAPPRHILLDGTRSPSPLNTPMVFEVASSSSSSSSSTDEPQARSPGSGRTPIDHVSPFHQYQKIFKNALEHDKVPNCLATSRNPNSVKEYRLPNEHYFKLPNSYEERMEFYERMIRQHHMIENILDCLLCLGPQGLKRIERLCQTLKCDDYDLSALQEICNSRTLELKKSYRANFYAPYDMPPDFLQDDITQPLEVAYAAAASVSPENQASPFTTTLRNVTQSIRNAMAPRIHSEERAGIFDGSDSEDEEEDPVVQNKNFEPQTHNNTIFADPDRAPTPEMDRKRPANVSASVSESTFAEPVTNFPNSLGFERLTPSDKEEPEISDNSSVNLLDNSTVDTKNHLIVDNSDNSVNPTMGKTVPQLFLSDSPINIPSKKPSNKKPTPNVREHKKTINWDSDSSSSSSSSSSSDNSSVYSSSTASKPDSSSSSSGNSSSQQKKKKWSSPSKRRQQSVLDTWEDDSSISDSSQSYSSSSSDSSDSSDNSSKSRKKRNTRNGRKQRRKSFKKTGKRSSKSKKQSSRKHKSRSSSSINYSLTKAASSHKKLQFVYHQDPLRRKQAFLNYVEHLRNIFSLVHETRKVLRNFPKIRNIHNSSAQRAVLSFLQATCDYYTCNLFTSLCSELDITNGIACLKHLQKLCAPHDDADTIQRLNAQFDNFKLLNDESLQKYSQRFTNLNRNLISTNIKKSQNKLVDQYLKGLRYHNSQQIQFAVETYKKDRSKGKRFYLHTVSSDLQAKEEQLLMDQKSQFQHMDDFNRTTNYPKYKHPRDHIANHTTATPPTTTNTPRPGFPHNNPGRGGRGGRGSYANNRNYNPQRNNNYQNRNNGNYHNNGPNNPGRGRGPSPRGPPPRGPKCFHCGGPHNVRSCKTVTPDRAQHLLNQHTTQKNSNPKANAVTSQKQNKSFFGTLDNAHVNMANVPSDSTKVYLPQANFTAATPKAKTKLRYESGVILDSGATHHMTGMFDILLDPQPHQVQVILADGSSTLATQQGTAEFTVYCKKHEKDFTIRLENCLYVPGFRNTLWSVPAFAENGHYILFRLNVVEVTLYAGQPEEITLHIPPPFAHESEFRDQQGRLIPQPAAVNAAIVRHSPQAPIKRRRFNHDLPGLPYPMRLLNRFIHITNTDTSDAYYDASINYTPSQTLLDLCIELHIQYVNPRSRLPFQRNLQPHTYIVKGDYVVTADVPDKQVLLRELRDVVVSKLHPLVTPDLSDYTTMCIGNVFLADITFEEHYIPSRFNPEYGSELCELIHSQQLPPDHWIHTYEPDIPLDFEPTDLLQIATITSPLSPTSVTDFETELLSLPMVETPPRENSSSPLLVTPQTGAVQRQIIDLDHPILRQNTPTSSEQAHANMVYYSERAKANAAKTRGMSKRQILNHRKQKQKENRTLCKVDLELMHQRLAHRSFQTLLAADNEQVWKDTKLTFAPDSFCIGCKIAYSRTANRGRGDVSEQDYPGQVLFMDIIHNPSHTSITSSSYYPYYLIVVCALSKYAALVPMVDKTSKHVIQAIKTFAVQHRPHKDFSLYDIAEIHGDADSAFLSQELKQWAQRYNTKLICAGSHHQEMNGLPERTWQTIRISAFAMLTHARLSHAFFHFAAMYAWQIRNVLPHKNLFKHDEELADYRPTTPYELYFHQKPNVRRFRVFGCPIVAKCYVKKHATSKRTMDDRNIIQRGLRAIFLGFPENQAGYMFYQPMVGEIGSSVDVSFDEHFNSPLAYNDMIFRDAEPTRQVSANYSQLAGETPFEQALTGPPHVQRDDAPASAPWTPYTALPPDFPPSNVHYVDANIFEEIAKMSSSRIMQIKDVPELHNWKQYKENPPTLSNIYFNSYDPYESDYAEDESTDSPPSDYLGIPLEQQDPSEHEEPNTEPELPLHINIHTDALPPVQEEPEAPETTEESEQEEVTVVHHNGVQQPEPTQTRTTRARTRSQQAATQQPTRRSNRIKHQRASANAVYSQISHSLSNVTPYQRAINQNCAFAANVKTLLATDAFHLNNVALANHVWLHPIDPLDEPGYEFAFNTMSDAIPPGEPGSDPLPFLPEPSRLQQVLKLPDHLREAWLKAWIKEIRGLIIGNECFSLEGEPGPDDKIIPLMEVFKCKLNKFGLVDKLKLRIVFRGDLHTPSNHLDSWNPHATWTALRLFLALCARYKIFPAQIDFIMAYVQTAMRGERVFTKFPAFWAKYLPEELRKYMGRPLLLKKALYGYNYSGRFLWEDQADFLQGQGLHSVAGMPALWVCHLPNGGIHLVLQYSDDWLSSCTCPNRHATFKQNLCERFNADWQARADWYLQARIQQDKDGNIYLDQQRYSKAIVKRYIPHADLNATEADKTKYANPLPFDMTFTKTDRSKTQEEVKALETKYGFRLIEAVPSLNFLSNTAFEELFAVRKLCSFLQLPGEKHFQALLHLLHHIRCHPPNALCYYRDCSKAPIASLLKEANLTDIEPSSLLSICDSAWGDCDDQRSTGCYLTMFQGGLVNYSSFVPSPISLSSAEAEINAMTVCCMATNYLRQVTCDVLFESPERPLTIPILTDSASGIFITQNERDTNRTRHIERRWMFTRACRLNGWVSIHHLSGDKHNIADLGTKNLPTTSNLYKLSIIEAPVSDYPILQN